MTKIIRRLEGPAYATGYEIIAKGGVGLVPLCPGNGYFSRSNVNPFLQLAAKTFERVELFIPDKPTEHTYRAIGISKPIESIARLQGNRLENMAKKIFDGELPSHFNLHRWKDIEQHALYQEQLNYHNALYENNPEFRQAVQAETRRVLVGQLERRIALDKGPRYIAEQQAKLDALDERIEIGVPYTLEEFAWVTAAPTILKADKLAYLYHKQWMIDNLIAGKYDRPRENLGMVIVE